MTIIKRHRHDTFAVIPTEVAEDERLSFEARGMLVYLLAKPNDWQVSVVDLQRRGRIGRDKAYQLLKELITTGYIERNRQQDPETGRITAFAYTIYDVAVQTSLPLTRDPLPDMPEMAGPDPETQEMAGNRPVPENPEKGQPLPGLPDTANQDAVTNIQSNLFTPLNPPSDDPAFEALLELWPDAEASTLASARRAFDRLTVSQRRVALAMVEATRRIGYQLGRPVPKLSAYLRHRLFQEADGAPPIDSGHFRITSDRPEWSQWLDATRRTHGERIAGRAAAQGFILTKSRWPDFHDHSEDA